MFKFNFERLTYECRPTSFSFLRNLRKLLTWFLGLLATHLAGLHIPKKRFCLAVLFKRLIFFLVLKQKKGLLASKKLLFLHRSAKKEPIEKNQ